MLTSDKITEFFYIADDFCKEFTREIKKLKMIPEGDKKCRKRSVIEYSYLLSFTRFLLFA